MGFDPGMGGFWVMALVSSLVSLAIAAGIIILIILGIRWLLRQEQTSGPSRPGGTSRGTDDALELLRQRYARGEIDDEEYERRRRILGG